MSRAHFQGATFAFSKWMADAAEEIARGERRGARVIYPPTPKQPVKVYRAWAARYLRDAGTRRAR